MRRWLMALMVFCLALFCPAVPARAAEGGFDADYARERTAVLATYVEMEDFQGVSGFGTCFFVGREGEDPSFLLTNHHVIEDYLENGMGERVQRWDEAGNTFDVRCTIRVFYDSNDSEEAYVVAYDEARDLAILKLGRATQKRKPFPLRAPEQQAAEVFVVGYPGIADNPLNEPLSQWSMDDVSIAVGHITRLMTLRGTGVKMIITDAAIQSGNSGGPLVDNGNCVVGINTQTVSMTDIMDESIEIEKIYYAVNVEEAIYLLDRNNVPYTLGGSGTRQPAGEGDAAEGGIAQEGGMETEAAAMAAETTTAAEEDAGDSGGLPVWAIVAAVAALCFLVLLVIWIVVRSRKFRASGGNPAAQGLAGGAAQGAMQSAAPPFASAPTAQGMPGIPSIRSLASQHRGERVSLRDREIAIGRDAGKCSIVFKDGTPGVSQIHCSLSYDKSSGKFRLTDLRSSYGTFLSSGKRLEAGVPCALRAGDSFYLGESGNTLIVEFV